MFEYSSQSLLSHNRAYFYEDMPFWTILVHVAYVVLETVFSITPFLFLSILFFIVSFDIGGERSIPPSSSGELKSLKKYNRTIPKQDTGLHRTVQIYHLI